VTTIPRHIRKQW